MYECKFQEANAGLQFGVGCKKHRDAIPKPKNLPDFHE